MLQSSRHTPCAVALGETSVVTANNSEVAMRSGHEILEYAQEFFEAIVEGKGPMYASGPRALEDVVHQFDRFLLTCFTANQARRRHMSRFRLRLFCGSARSPRGPLPTFLPTTKYARGSPPMRRIVA
jgi:hypothetical protein